MRFVTALLALSLAAGMARAEIRIQEFTSPGGIDAWLTEDDSIPFVALELRFLGGASLDAAGARGATNLMVGLLEEGAGDRDARAFATAAERIAADFDFDASDDSVSISARFLTETTDEAATLLADALAEPRFDPDAIDRVRAQVLSAIRRDRTDPDALASEAFYSMAFGDHPYATAIEGTVDSVTALDRDALVTAHRAALARDRVFVSAAGDISAKELGRLIDRILGDLPATGAPMPDSADVTTEAGVTVVPFATPQSVAVFGHEGLPRDHPDFFAAFVLNTILGGGGFEARLQQEVRVKRGLTYGVNSYLVPKDSGALYLGQVSSANDRIAEAIEVIREEWARVAAEGVTREELDEVKTYLTGAYPLRFDGNARIARILAGMQTDGLDPSYVETRNDMVRALTLEDVNRVASEILKPDQLHFVVVGQPAGLAAPGQ